jgi:uncharacterized protein
VSDERKDQMKPLCLYHRSDLDGKCSGYIVRRHLPDVELLGIEYGDELDWSELADRHVYLVDFSLQPWADMKRLAETASQVTWIDHHKSAIEEFKKSPIQCDGLRSVNYSGCELSWQFFNQGSVIPRAVYLLGRYDVWDLTAHDDVLPFQMGMRLDTWLPDDERWDSIVAYDAEEAIERITRTGITVLKYQDNQNRGLMRKAFVHRWKELVFLAVNAGGINSKAFDSKFDSGKHDAVMSFFYDGSQNKWTVSLYSPDQKQDLSGIAKEMGGGGHAAACGFQVDNLGWIDLPSGISRSVPA